MTGFMMGERLSLLVDRMREKVVLTEVRVQNEGVDQDDIEDVLTEFQGWLNDADDLLFAGRAAA